MILKALYDYYIRSVESEPNSLPPYGFESAEIAYAIVITKDGEFKRVASCGKREGMQHFAELWVPRGSGRTSDKTAQILWDKVIYVLGFKNGKIERTSDERSNFISVIRELVDQFPSNETFSAVYKFYQKEQYYNVIKKEKDKECILECSNSLFVSFSILGENDIVASYTNDYVRADLISYIQFKESQIKDRGICLVTGKTDCPIVIKTGITPLLSATSGKLVSFQENRGYDSYGYSKGKNAPISTRAEHAIYIALKTLLSKDVDSQENDNRIDIVIQPKKSRSQNGRMVKIGTKQRAYVFWCSENVDTAENFITNAFTPKGSEKDIKDTLLSFKKRPILYDENIKFYLLGLSPNGKARIAINFWAEMPLGQAVKNITAFFEDVYVEGRYKVLYNVITLMQSSTKAKKDKITKKLIFDFRANMSEYIVKAIFFNQLLPDTLVHDCIQRFTIEQRPTSSDDDLTLNEFEKRENIRAGILKLYLNKRETSYNNKQIYLPMLDKENKQPCYLCGRLFAVLEWIQGGAYNAQRNPNNESEKTENASNEYRSNIRERFIDAASTAPSSVFPTLIRLSSHHSATLRERGYYDFEPLKEEIINSFEKGTFPDILDIKQQGGFFIGYYQQRQALYPPKEKK